mgnify:CR=1 FL=1
MCKPDNTNHMGWSLPRNSITILTHCVGGMAGTTLEKVVGMRTASFVKARSIAMQKGYLKRRQIEHDKRFYKYITTPLGLNAIKDVLLELRDAVTFCEEALNNAKD